MLTEKFVGYKAGYNDSGNDGWIWTECIVRRMTIAMAIRKIPMQQQRSMVTDGFGLAAAEILSLLAMHERCGIGVWVTTSNIAIQCTATSAVKPKIYEDLISVSLIEQILLLEINNHRYRLLAADSCRWITIIVESNLLYVVCNLMTCNAKHTRIKFTKCYDVLRLSNIWVNKRVWHCATRTLVQMWNCDRRQLLCECLLCEMSCIACM